ncbi:MAG: hypothetical protein ABR598_05615, partial [Candidatus Dormibacteria bacterium]
GSFRTLAPRHPDNPHTGLSPGEYIRLRRAAMFQRQAAKRGRTPARPGPSAAAGPGGGLVPPAGAGPPL